MQRSSWHSNFISGLKTTYICVALENITFSTKTLLLLLMSESFFTKISIFWQNSTFTQTVSMRAVFKMKGYCFRKYNPFVRNSASRLLQSNHKSEKLRRNLLTQRLCPIFFWRCRTSIVNLSYWSRFQVNIIFGSGVTQFLCLMDLTRNLEILIPPSKLTQYLETWIS